MGDDLRQDQLVIQLITLMDKLLKKENLDLKLTPYRVLATSFSAGLFFNRVLDGHVRWC
jgi:phosphatidylinositol 3-kinase